MLCAPAGYLAPVSTNPNPQRPLARLARPASPLSNETEHEQSPPPAHITPAELSVVLAIPVKTLEYWRGRNEGPPFTRIGRSVRYSLPEVHAWLRRNTVSA